MSLGLLCPVCDSALDSVGACSNEACDYSKPALPDEARDVARAGIEKVREVLASTDTKVPPPPPREPGVHEVVTKDPTVEDV